MNRIFTAIIAIVLSACANTPQITNYESQGNLEAPDPAECVEIKQLKSDQNPADIFRGMKKCINSENYALAAEMYFGAMTYGIYDTQRVSDKTAHQGLMVLRMNTLSGLPEQKTSKLQSEINLILENNSSICASLEARGLPTYHPRYMIQHGMGAFTGQQTKNGLVDNFDSRSAWVVALEKTVKCQKS